ncbi:MAG: glutamate 5-kinase [Methanomassiliicoccales archaeon]
MARDLLKEVQRVVVKIGTTSITDDSGLVDREFMDGIARQVRDLRKMGKEVILVSSGAIGLGLQIMGVAPKPKEVPLRQAAASVGQNALMQEWKTSFDRVGINIAQILLTYDFYSDRITYLNLRNNISTLLECGVVPIINENDALCVHEIQAVFGDNDTLSGMVASKMEADLLIILSDVDGLFDRNPKNHPDARLIPTVKEITPEIEAFGGNPTSTKGVGGMKTKIQAAKICCISGCHMIITNHDLEEVLPRTMRGEELGTIFVANDKVKGSRTRWILLSNSYGTIRIDPGARKALGGKGGLLPSGVIGVRGQFDRGDVVELECEGEVFAKGITDYSSYELNRIKGAHTDRVEAILGYKNYSNIIRRDNLGFMGD